MARRDVIVSSGRAVEGEAAPVVSVVIICYNHGRFLGEAIESVLAQTLRDPEIVVVDDGSTDETPAVAARYPSVRYLRQANQGMAAARNAGFEASRGRYVSFLDADDRLLANALLVGAACLDRHPDCAFVSGHYRRITLDGSEIPTVQHPCVVKDHYRAFLAENYVGMHAAVLFRREAIERVSGFDARLKACDDYDIYLRISRLMPVFCHDRIVAEYRWHGANASFNWRRMLRSTLGPLRAQRRYVRGNRELTAAYRTGVRTCQQLYGEPLVTETIAAMRLGQWRCAVLGLGTLLRYDPRSLWRGVVARILSTGRRLRASHL